MTEATFVAKRVEAGVPIWDIFAHGRDIGCATIFDYDDEGPMATVHYDYREDNPVTFQDETLHAVLAKVGTYLRGIDERDEAEAKAEHYAEVIAPMEAAERLAERGAEQDWFEPPYLSPCDHEQYEG